MTGSAKQSSATKKELDCFVARAPRNDGERAQIRLIITAPVAFPLRAGSSTGAACGRRMPSCICRTTR
jgi:hypothetical protein